MTGVSDRPTDPFETLELERCCEVLGPPTREELARGLDGFLSRVNPHRAPRPRPWRRWALVGAAAVLTTLAGLQAPSLLRRLAGPPAAATLAYRIEGGRELENGFLHESGATGLGVLFNEGSRFHLAPGARGRIRAVDKQGAHLAVERGTASLRITPGGPRRWLVDVGPFLVTVKGTVFTVSWDPSGEQFELHLQRGQVAVKGPVSAGEITLRSGQVLRVNLARSQSIISEESPVGQARVVVPELSPPAREMAPVASAAASPSPINPSRIEKAADDHGWRGQLARGRWDRILEEVKRLGVNETLSKASSEDLFALANAARYHHETDLARAALLAERRRFPGTPRAQDALYLLGRVDETRESGTAQAIAWYDEYLAHAPTGPLVGEALGRKMILTEKLEGPARARAVAQDYLRRFPKGNYAGSAREFVAAP